VLAALLGWSQATFASKLKIQGDKAEVTARSTEASRRSR